MLNDDGEPVVFKTANKFRTKKDQIVDYFEGVEGFKMAGNNQKMKVNLP